VLEMDRVRCKIRSQLSKCCGDDINVSDTDMDTDTDNLNHEHNHNPKVNDNNSNTQPNDASPKPGAGQNSQQNAQQDAQNGLALPAVAAISLLRPALAPAPTPLEYDDWSSKLPSTNHVRFFQTTDWSATLLGPLHQWNVALRIHVFTMFADSKPSCLYWGPQKTAIYNEPFALLAVFAVTFQIYHILILS
jgi:hypothetical protein